MENITRIKKHKEGRKESICDRKMKTRKKDKEEQEQNE